MGDTTATVTVTADAPLIDSEGGSLGQVIGSKKVEEIPVKGRNVFYLAILTPGVWRCHLLPVGAEPFHLRSEERQQYLQPAVELKRAAAVREQPAAASVSAACQREQDGQRGDDDNIADSNYHSLQIKVQKMIARGYSFLLSHSKSKAIDDSSGRVFGVNSFAPPVQSVYNLRAEAYNLMNRPYFRGPGVALGASNFRVISSAAGDRQMQLALKVIS